eukprot:48013-Eustigmatos_ZCMA.PRE.1
MVKFSWGSREISSLQQDMTGLLHVNLGEVVKLTTHSCLLDARRVGTWDAWSRPLFNTGAPSSRPSRGQGSALAVVVRPQTDKMLKRNSRCDG